MRSNFIESLLPSRSTSTRSPGMICLRESAAPADPESGVDRATQRPCSISRVVALLRMISFAAGASSSVIWRSASRASHALKKHSNDSFELFLASGLKIHDFIDAVDKLRPEAARQPLPSLLCGRRSGSRLEKLKIALEPTLPVITRTVLRKIHSAAFAVGETAVFENLQQHV